MLSPPTPFDFNAGEEEKNKGDGVGERRHDRPAGCFGSVRLGGAQPRTPDQTLRTETVWGRGGREVEREEMSPNDFYPVQM